MLNDFKNALLDLSVDSHNISRIGHSKFSDKKENIEIEIIRENESMAFPSVCVDDQEEIQAEMIVNETPFELFKSTFINHIQKLSSQQDFDVIKIQKTLDNFAILFEQQLPLKKAVLREICANALRPTKIKVNRLNDKYIQKMKDKGKDVDEMEQKYKDKKPIFLGYFGKYLEDKCIARYVQKDILKNQLIQQEQIDLYNGLSLQYRNLKHEVIKSDANIERLIPISPLRPCQKSSSSQIDKKVQNFLKMRSRLTLTNDNQDLLLDEETQNNQKMRHSIDLFNEYRHSFFDDIPKDPLLQNENVEQVINNFYQIHNDPQTKNTSLQLEEIN